MSVKYLSLAEAAALIGHPTDFLEMLEREGIIELKRTLDGVVVVSSATLERARVIAVLMEELEVNLAGAEVILHMREDMIAMQRQFGEILTGLVDELKREIAVEARRTGGSS